MKLVCNDLGRSTGFEYKLVDGKVKNGIYFGRSLTVEDDEGYGMEMNGDVVSILGNTRHGLFYGFQSLLQLLPVDIVSSSVVYRKWFAPRVKIVDSPRMKWRGVMLDPCRHFFDVSTVCHIIDALSRFKINVIQLHLTEDQGWRFESKKFPNLTVIGSKRDASPIMWRRKELDNETYGPFFYTQDELRFIVDHARRRSITIVPELEMPGHGLAALSAFPHLSCTGGPFSPRCHWGVEPDVYCAGNDDAIKFLEDIIDEYLDVFDSEYIHIGGDECPKDRWKLCPKCQQRIKDNNLRDEFALQSWFIRHFVDYLASKGRKAIGWDEILEGGLPDGAAVMSWRSTSGGEAATRAGHQVVMTPNPALYLDRTQFSSPDGHEYISGF